MNDHLIWKKVSSESVLEGPRPVDRVKFLFPDGHESAYDIRRDADSSVIFAITPDERVVLAKQFRPGKMEVLLEMPGGGVKIGQTALQAAEAELREEVGYTGELEFVGQSWPDAYSTRRSNVFVARNCVCTGDWGAD
jgi:ADP-ribose pyrophosphatase